MKARRTRSQSSALTVATIVKSVVTQADEQTLDATIVEALAAFAFARTNAVSAVSEANGAQPVLNADSIAAIVKTQCA